MSIIFIVTVYKSNTDVTGLRVNVGEFMFVNAVGLCVLVWIQGHASAPLHHC